MAVASCMAYSPVDLGGKLVVVPTSMCYGRRILVFLANTMPLDERSGVNLQGSFNTAHSTPVEDVPEVKCPWICC